MCLRAFRAGTMRPPYRWFLSSLVAIVALGSSVAVAGAGTGALTLLTSNAAGVPASEATTGSFTSSDDGTKVAFESFAPNLVSPSPPGIIEHVYVKDAITGAVTLASSNSAGVPSNGYSQAAGISRNGRYIAFWSAGTNLDPADTDVMPDVYVKDLVTGHLTLASTNAAGEKGDGDSSSVNQLAVSSDGNTVVIASRSGNYDPRQTKKTCDHDGTLYDCTEVEVYAKNLATGALTLLSGGDNGRDLCSYMFSLSGDASRVLFATQESLSPDDGDGGLCDLYSVDTVTAAATLVSTTRPAGTADTGLQVGFGSISADGNRVVFDAYDTGLPPFDRSEQSYLKDLTTGAVTLISSNAAGAAGNGRSQVAQISGDGRYVSFSTFATNFDPADTDEIYDIYLKDLDTGALTLVSQRDDAVKGDGHSFSSRPADGGGRVAFISQSTNLVAGSDEYDNAYSKIVLPPAPPPADADGDGVVDAIDVGNGAFNDGALTSGSIVNANGLAVLVSDAVAPDGVRIVVSGPGAALASISVCGGFSLKLPSPSDVTVTCGSVTVKVTTGTARIELGTTIVVSIPAGVTARVSDTGGGGFSVQNLGGGTVTVTRNGTPSSIAAGQTVSVDASPPVITAILGGTLGNGGWYRSNVTVTWTVLDGQSAITARTGCTANSVTADTAGMTFTCSATSGGGTTATTVTVKRDATPPTASYGAHPATYTVDQTIAIGCMTSDAGSGVATSCQPVAGPAYTFGLGSVTRSSTASDVAGNTRIATTSFTVTVTAPSLCALTRQLVQGSPKYAASTTSQRVPADVLAAAGCTALNSIRSNTPTATKNALRAAYKLSVGVLVQQGWLSSAQGTTLGTLSNSL
jgi:hypothetical protein